MKSATTSTRSVHTQAALLRRRCRSALQKHKARAKALGIFSLSYGQDDLMHLAESARTCCYCRTPLGFSTMQFDHATPTSRGGAFTIENVVVCCSRDNALKGALTREEFALLRELLVSLHPAARADLERRLLSGGQRYCRR